MTKPRRKAEVDQAWDLLGACWGTLEDLRGMQGVLDKVADIYTARIRKLELALDFCAGVDVETGAKLTRKARRQRLLKDDGRVARRALRGRLAIDGVVTPGWHKSRSRAR